MPQGGPIPRKNADFNDYVNIVILYLNVNFNKNRLVTSAAALAALADITLKYGLPPPTPPAINWLAIYPLNQNKSTRTGTTIAQEDTLRAQLESGLRIIYKDIAESNLTQTDRDTLKLPARDTTPTTKPKITIAPAVTLKSLDGGQIQFRCRIDKDATRASMHPDADAIQVKYKIGGTKPNAIADLPNSFISKKALFIIDAGEDFGGKTFYAAARWVNLTTPANSGPSSTISHTTIVGEESA